VPAKPETVPKVKELEATRAEVEAVPVIARFVVVAWVAVRVEAKSVVVVAFVVVLLRAVRLPVTVSVPSTVDDACDTKPEGRRTVMVVVGAR
jgi:hypothetical protein